MKNIGLTMDSISFRPMSDMIKINGYLDVPPHSEAIVTSLIEARVVRIHITPFEKVAKGDLLIEMEGPELLNLQQEYLEHKSEMGFTEKEFERRSQLFEGGHISARDYEISKRDYELLKASIAGLASRSLGWMEEIRVVVTLITQGRGQ